MLYRLPHYSSLTVSTRYNVASSYISAGPLPAAPRRMDVLRSARGRLDAADYVAVKCAWLDAQRQQLVASSLRATPAETRRCADALLSALPALHGAPRRRCVRQGAGRDHTPLQVRGRCR